MSHPSPPATEPLSNQECVQTWLDSQLRYPSAEFARLVPSNLEACQAYNALAQQMMDGPDHYAHARRFLHIHPRQGFWPSDRQSSMESGSRTGMTTETETETEAESESRTVDP